MTANSSVLNSNKALVRRFFATFSEASFQDALSFMSDEATWWTTGGTKTKAEMGNIAQLIEGNLKAPLKFEVGTLTAEEDRVAAEAKSQGELTNGRIYANAYHFLFRIADGQLVEIREHCDTQHAQATWGDVR